MDVKRVLDILGNESRRKILELLATKPCYVSEISYNLKMAPKVVIEHLEKLEKAGIVKSFEIGKRRYYCIDKSFGVEVLISPYRFKMEVFESKNGEIFEVVEEFRDLIEKFENIELDDISSIYNAIVKLNEVHNVIIKLQSMLIAKFNRFAERLLKEVEKVAESDLERLVMIAIINGVNNATEIADTLGIPYTDVERALNVLMNRGFVKKVGDEWVIL